MKRIVVMSTIDPKIIRRFWDLIALRCAQWQSVVASKAPMENTQDLGYGWLYVVTHPNGPGLIKIGITDRPEARMNDLGNPEILARIPVKNPRKYETDLHRLYQSQRLPQSEWFNLSKNQTEELLDNVSQTAQRFLSIVIFPERPAESAEEIDSAQDELSLLRSQISAMREDMSKLARANSSLGEDHRKLQVKWDSLYSDFKKCKASKDSVSAELETSKTELKNAKAEKDSLIEANSTLKELLSKASTLLIGANLSMADLNRCKLLGVDLRGACLCRANLLEADLSGSDFTQADLEGSDLSGANLQGVNFNGADLTGARFWYSRLSGVIWNEHTKWPTALEFVGALDMSAELKQRVGCT